MGNFISNYANIPNPITKFFNKIDYVRLCEDYSKMIWCLEAMKKVPLYVKKISIPSNYEEELEILTDPNLHNTPISNLELKLLDSFCFSSKTIENLKAIYPNLITLEADDSDLFCNDETLYQALFQNFTKLLSNLDQTSLQVDFECYYFNFKLEFRDVIFKVVESKEECSYIRATSVEIRCKYEELCWIKTGDLNTSILDSYYFCLNKSSKINISEFVRIKNQEEIKEVEKMFSNEACSEINEGIIIPMKYSNGVFFTIKDCRSNLFDKAKVEEYQKTIEVMTHIKDIQYEWDIGSNYDFVNKYLPLLPSRTKYTLVMDYFDLKAVPDFYEKLRMLNWNDRRIYLIRCWEIQQLNVNIIGKII